MTQPKVSIIVTSYLPENKRYLDLCMRSIANLDYPRELLDVIVVTRPGYAPMYDDAVTIAPDREEFGCAESVNFGISWASEDSKFIWTLNDDVIVTRDSLKNLVQLAADNEIILNPTSNCDNFGLYDLILGFMSNDSLVTVRDRSYTYEDLSAKAEHLMNAKSFYPQGLITQPHLFFYATLIPRRVIEKLGLFDEKFKTGQDDIDYSKRAKAQNVSMAIALNAVVWHFSGATANKTMSEDMRCRNLLYFKEKWGEFPFGQDLKIEATPDLTQADLRDLDFIGE